MVSQGMTIGDLGDFHITLASNAPTPRCYLYGLRICAFFWVSQGPVGLYGLYKVVVGGLVIEIGSWGRILHKYLTPTLECPPIFLQ